MTLEKLMKVMASQHDFRCIVSTTSFNHVAFRELFVDAKVRIDLLHGGTGSSEHWPSLRRRKYKSRFQKWQLPNLEAFAALREGSSLPSTIDQKVPSDEHFFATFSHELAGQTVPDCGECPQKELVVDSNVRSDIHIGGTESENRSYGSDVLCELSAMPSCDGEPQIDSSSTSPLFLSLYTAALSAKELPVATIAKGLSTQYA
jgi:Clr5 domain